MESSLSIASFNAENFYLLLDANYSRAELEALDEADYLAMNSSIYNPNKERGKIAEIARTILEGDFDLVGLCEVGGMETLSAFNRIYLGDRYDCYLHEENSRRGIFVGALAKRGRFPGARARNVPGAFSRNLLRLDLGPEGGDLEVFIVHLKSQHGEDRGLEQRIWEVGRLASLARSRNCVVMGDFNGILIRGEEEFEYGPFLELPFRDVLEAVGVPPDKRRTHYYFNPAPNFAQLDYIFCTEDIEILDAGVLEGEIPLNKAQRALLPSDHLFIRANIRPLSRPEAASRPKAERSTRRHHKEASMQLKSALKWLVPAIALLALAATLAGLWPSGGKPYPITNFRGEAVTINARGLYHWDTLSSAAQMQANDLVALLLGLPLLLIAFAKARKGSLRGLLLLSGTLGFFLYTYASMCFGAAYNALFLVYVALFALSLYAFILALMSVDIEELPGHFSPRLPRRWIAGLLFAAGAFLGLAWLGKIAASLKPGALPALENVTTMFIQAMDLALIVPLCFLAGILLLKKKAWGYLLASVGMLKFLTMGTAVSLMALNMARVGVPVGPAELLVFPAITAANAVTVVFLLKNIEE